MKIKESDNVLVIAGKDKGKKGKIMRLLRKQDKVVVEKINVRTKHVKKTATRPGEIIRFEAPINVSNVKVICPNCTKTTRVGYIKLDTGKKQRVCKKCKQSLDKATVKKK